MNAHPKHWAHCTFHSSGVKFDTHISARLNSLLRIPFSTSVFEMNHHAYVSGFNFSQKKKSMRSWSHYNVCVFVFLANEQNQCGRIMRNIENTRPVLRRGATNKVNKETSTVKKKDGITMCQDGLLPLPGKQLFFFFFFFFLTTVINVHTHVLRSVHYC